MLEIYLGVLLFLLVTVVPIITIASCLDPLFTLKEYFKLMATMIIVLPPLAIFFIFVVKGAFMLTGLPL